MSRVIVAHAAAGAIVIAVALALATASGEAHKPITSPYTFNDDVFPIIKDKCGACHAPHAVAPMSLLTHADAVPWGESMKAELMAGHMPPWTVAGAPGRFRNVQQLTARELNVLLTWASGGTPVGSADKAPTSAPHQPRWPLGEPDLVLPLEQVTLAADVQERVAEFTVRTGMTSDRWVRAADLLPGAAAIVRSATMAVQAPGGRTAGESPEGFLALWVPGDHPMLVDPGAGFRLPAGADLVVRVRYRKTWEYEREVVSDQSRIGLYLTDGPAADVRTMRLAPSERASSAGPGVVSFTSAMSESLQALAVYPDPLLANAAITMTAARPDGAREELIAFRPRAGWARRYWFLEPIALPAGTTIEVQATFEDGTMLPPGALPPPPPDPSALRLFVDVIPAP